MAQGYHDSVTLHVEFGSLVQRSGKSLVASLPYQTLRQNPFIASQLLVTRPGLSGKRSNGDWSVEEATEILHLAFQIADRSFCVFIDGLDELDDDESYPHLLSFIDTLSDAQGKIAVKNCVSSRPEPQLSLKLQEFPSLRLQDITKHDIEIITQDFLKEAPADQRLNIVRLVVTKADGVSLWVHYALKSIVRGLSQQDDWSEIEERINVLPKKVESLYHDMWQRLNEDEPIYRKEAAKFFHIALQLGSTSIFEFMTASNPPLQASFLEKRCMVPLEEMVKRFARFEQLVMTRCASLLEVVEDVHAHLIYPEQLEQLNTNRSSPSPAQLTLLRRLKRRGTFLHRTARDFLIDTEIGQGILHHWSPLTVDWSLLQLRTDLVAMLSGLQPFGWGEAAEQMRAWLEASRVEDLAIADLETLNLMDQVYQRLIPAESSDCASALSRTRPRSCPTVYFRDFRGLTAYFGLLRYVRKFFDQGFAPRKQYLNYLLLCSSTVFSGTAEKLCGTPENRFEMIRFLLERGADPNACDFFPLFPPEIGEFYTALNTLPSLFSIMSPESESLKAELRQKYTEMFLFHGLDVSKRMVLGVHEGVPTSYFDIQNDPKNMDSRLIYETSIADFINEVYLLQGEVCSDKRISSRNHAKDRRILYIDHNYPDKRTFKVLTAGDIELLGEKLNAYLSVFDKTRIKEGGLSFQAKSVLKASQEYIELNECIKQVNARSGRTKSKYRMKLYLELELGYVRGYQESDIMPIKPFDDPQPEIEQPSPRNDHNQS